MKRKLMSREEKLLVRLENFTVDCDRASIIQKLTTHRNLLDYSKECRFDVAISLVLLILILRAVAQEGQFERLVKTCIHLSNGTFDRLNAVGRRFYYRVFQGTEHGACFNLEHLKEHVGRLLGIELEELRNLFAQLGVTTLKTLRELAQLERAAPIDPRAEALAMEDKVVKAEIKYLRLLKQLPRKVRNQRYKIFKTCFQEIQGRPSSGSPKLRAPVQSQQTELFTGDPQHGSQKKD